MEAEPVSLSSTEEESSESVEIYNEVEFRQMVSWLIERFGIEEVSCWFRSEVHRCKRFKKNK